jgi:hypothetical protein
VLRVGGKRFDVEACVGVLGLKVLRIYRRGQPRSPARPRGPKNLFSGANVLVSDREFSDYNSQVRDAIRYLKRNQKLLRRLRHYSGVEWAYLDFGVELRDVAVHCDVLPEQLVMMAGNLGLGIEVSHYPPLGATSMLERPRRQVRRAREEGRRRRTRS